MDYTKEQLIGLTLSHAGSSYKISFNDSKRLFEFEDIKTNQSHSSDTFNIDWINSNIRSGHFKLKEPEEPKYEIY